MEQTSKRVAVIGAGVVGVCTALRLAEGLNGATVTLISECFSPNTTGDGSAGFISPYLLGDRVPREKIRRWCKETFDFLKEILLSPDAESYGVGLLSSFDLHEEPVALPEHADVFPEFRDMSPTELQLFPSKYKHGFFITTYYLECTKLLPVLIEKFNRKGGRIIQQKINALNELSGRYDVVVNCTGLGSVQLAGDTTLKPIRGQVIRVRAPWIKHCVLGKDYYIIPNTNEVILGGTHQVGDWNRTPDPEDRSRIWKGCLQLMPSLQTAEVTQDWVGLRPGRPSLRLELDTNFSQNGPMQVVHNYGHGGSGVTLAWACAGDVVGIVEGALNGHHKAQL